MLSPFPASGLDEFYDSYFLNEETEMQGRCVFFKVIPLMQRFEPVSLNSRWTIYKLATLFSLAMKITHLEQSRHQTGSF